jgi:eukaryotic-like serine/threonine-protein kinase
MTSTTGTHMNGRAADHRGLELVHEMRRRWEQGGQPRAEEFLDARPELWEQAEAGVDLVYEEFCLRHAAGQSEVAADLLRRFPQWAGPLRVMLDCHRLLQSGGPATVAQPEFPAVGDTVGEFRLLEALGRGLHGRVFLAAQPGLADRPVVLKFTPQDGREHLLLARLQHTNIVPLHAVSDDPARGLRVLCMPYFGRATLAAVLQALAGEDPAARTGRHIVEAIDRLQAPATPTAGAARRMLAHASYVQAVCWIGAALADGLQFAHDRGLVHLDLKPENVLLATDGQPMLLDFHLAHAPIVPAGPSPEYLGGTPDYMPPEQRAAIRSLQTGAPVEGPVDGRADVYSLGAVLYEALGGSPPAADSPSLARVNPRVSVGLADVIARCLADRPNDRYATAAGLADDLRRHLTDRPLVGVPNRSPRERWDKWRRRRPGALRTAAALAAVALLFGGAWWHVRDRRLQAEAALHDGEAQMRDGGRPSEAVHTFERGLSLLETRPFQDDLRRQLREQLGTARRLQLAQQLHTLADEIRGVYGATAVPPDRMRSLTARCQACWERRAQIVDTLRFAPPAAPTSPTSEVADDLLDVALFTAELEVALAGPTTGGHAALRMVDDAEALFGPSAVLAHVRRTHRQAIGLSPAPDHAPPARTAREHYALGRSYLAVGDLPRAADALAAALAAGPADRWANHYFGLCAYRLGRYEDAVAAFSVCIGSAPTSAGCFYNRGLAYAALARTELARRDFDRARELDLEMAPIQDE